MIEKSVVKIFDRDQFRENLLPFTRKAYGLLPPMNQPNILDIGCGSGTTTIELARLSDGDVVGLDINQKALDRLAQKASAANLSDRITTLCASMHDMVFPPESFDIIWTEGAISFIGLKQAMQAWRSLLAPGGYLVVHDRLAVLNSEINMAEKCNYAILNRFRVSQEEWWSHYYLPLKKHLEELRQSGQVDAGFMGEMKALEDEIASFDRNSDLYGSLFILLQKFQAS